MNPIHFALLGGLLIATVSNAGARERDRTMFRSQVQCTLSPQKCVESLRGKLLSTDRPEEWEVSEVRKTKIRTFVRLVPRVHGLRVVGATAVVTLDQNHRVLFVDGAKKRIQVDPPKSDIGTIEAERRAMETIHRKHGGALPNPDSQKVSEKVALVDGYVGEVAYEVKVPSVAGKTTYFVYIHSESGDTLWVRNPTLH